VSIYKQTEIDKILEEVYKTEPKWKSSSTTPVHVKPSDTIIAKLDGFNLQLHLISEKYLAESLSEITIDRYRKYQVALMLREMFWYEIMTQYKQWNGVSVLAIREGGYLVVIEEKGGEK